LINIVKRNIKYIIMALCFAGVILFSMYKVSYIDFINETVMYFPLFILIASILINLEVFESNMQEIYYSSKANIKIIFLKRMLRLVILESILLVVNYVMFNIFFDIEYTHELEKVMYWQASFLSSFFFIGIAALFCAILKNKAMTLTVVSIIWIYWIINPTKLSILNPFIFTAGPIYLDDYKYIQLGFILVMLFVAMLIESKGPFWVKDKIVNRRMNKLW